MKYGMSRDHPLMARIQSAYEASGNDLGWRFLYSPASVLSGARVAFISFQPSEPPHPDLPFEFATMRGSGFATERWGEYRAGQSPSQRQVLGLFEALDVQPDEVLAGNFVPFRSPDWSALKDRRAALSFSRTLWSEVLAEAAPRLIIASGKHVGVRLEKMLGARRTLSLPIGWGNVEATRSEFDTGTLISLPDLGRIKIINRPQSTPALKRLFLEHWRG